LKDELIDRPVTSINQTRPVQQMKPIETVWSTIKDYTDMDFPN
jgi:hypothetical protein